MSKIIKFLSMVAVAVTAVFATSCNTGDDSSEDLNAFYKASPANFKAELDAVKASGANYVIIDYRDAASYAAGHIEDAVNYEATATNTASNTADFCKWILAKYPTTYYVFLYGQDATKEYYVPGRVSKLGYGKAHTWSLSNGYNAWVAAGY